MSYGPPYGQAPYGQPSGQPQPYQQQPPAPGYGAPPPGYGQPTAQYGFGPNVGGYPAPPPQSYQGPGPYGAPAPAPYAASAAPYYPPPGGAGGYGQPAPFGAPPAAGGYGQAPPGHSPYGSIPQAFHPPSGKKKALLVGINYKGSANELHGCINDIRNFEYFLKSKFGFQPENFLVLTEDNPNPIMHPTRANIMNGFAWLMQGAAAGDSLVFQYSGHGSQVKDLDGDEEDGMDETICPLDWRSAGQIIDDTIHACLVKPLPVGARLLAVMDCCHSGTGMDLPFEHRPESSGQAGGAQAFLNQAGYGYQMAPAYGSFHMGRSSNSKRSNRSTRKQQEAMMNPVCAGDVILFSGCQDSQTSADTTGMPGGVATGAMTYALIAALEKNPVQTYNELYVNMLHALKGKFTQVPQLSTARPFNMNQHFSV